MKRIKDTFCFAIVHDVDYFPMNKIFGSEIRAIADRTEGIFDFSDVFSTSRAYFPKQPWPGHTGPPTLLGSNFETDLPEVDYF